VVRWYNYLNLIFFLWTSIIGTNLFRKKGARQRLAAFNLRPMYSFYSFVRVVVQTHVLGENYLSISLLVRFCMFSLWWDTNWIFKIIIFSWHNWVYQWPHSGQTTIGARYTCLVVVHKETIDKLRNIFFWQGQTKVTSNKSKIIWDLICQV
jgi:uncharacterized membrane protein